LGEAAWQVAVPVSRSGFTGRGCKHISPLAYGLRASELSLQAALGAAGVVFDAKAQRRKDAQRKKVITKVRKGGKHEKEKMGWLGDSTEGARVGRRLANGAEWRGSKGVHSRV
jgi:hypothetical protein